MYISHIMLTFTCWDELSFGEDTFDVLGRSLILRDILLKSRKISDSFQFWYMYLFSLTEAKYKISLETFIPLFISFAHERSLFAFKIKYFQLSKDTVQRFKAYQKN